MDYRGLLNNSIVYFLRSRFWPRCRLVDDLRAALGQRVRRLRERAGLSQEQLAERADLHVTYVSGIERGKRNPGLNILACLARALKMSLPALVTELRPQAKVRVRRGRPRKRIQSST